MTGLSIHTSYASNKAFMLAKQRADLSTSVSRLSSGDRIARAADDVASLSVSTSLSSRVKALKIARTNTAQASTLLEVADAGMAQIDGILQRMTALATMSNSGSVSDAERGFLDQEFQQLKNEIDRIANETNFNGVNLLNRYVEPEAVREVKTEGTVEDPSSVYLTFQPFAPGAGNAPPSAPIDTNAAANDIAEDAANGTAVGITGFSTDPEAGAITYSLSNNAGGRFAIDPVTGVVTVANSALLDFESNTSHTISIRATDIGGLSSTASFTINVTNVNEAPFVAAGLTDQAGAEGVAFNYSFPAQPGAFDDPDTPDPLTYSIVGALPGWLSFNAGTRTFSGTPGGGDAGVYTVTVRATDGGGLFVDDSFDITIASAPQPPTDFDLDNLAINENSAVGTVIGNLINVVDADLPGDVHTFSIAPGGDPDGVFQVVGTQLRVGGAMDFETATTHNVTIRVTDSTGQTYDELFTINVNNVNENPFVTGGLTDQAVDVGNLLTYNFPAQPGTFDDPDVPDPLTYSVVGALPGWLSFNAGTQTFSGTPGAGDVGTVTITVRATDGGGLFVDDSFDIVVSDPNDPPTDFDLDNLAVDENSAVGTLIGNLINIVDPDLPGDVHTFSIAPGGDPDGVFQISGTQLEVGGAMDFETATTHNVTIRVTDAGGLFYDELFTINVNNVNEAPFVTGGLADQVTNEAALFNYTFPAQPGTFDDPDVPDPLTYSIVGALPGWLSFNAGTQTFSGTPGAGDVGTVTITVRATDGGGLFVDDSFDITVNNVNQAPTDFDLDNLAVDENSAVGTLIGNLINIVDPDLPGDLHTFSIAPGGDPDGVFQITGTQLEVGGAMDFETATTHNVTIRVTDAGGLFYDELFTINVNDINEAPTDFDLDNLAVDENSAVGTLIGNLINIVDQDALDTHTFSIAPGGDPDGVFQITGTQLEVGGAMDFETATTHNVTIRVTDAGGLFYDELFTINVNNVNENPFVTGGLVDQTVDEGNLLTYTFPAQPATFDDPDVPDPLTYSIVGALPGWLSFNAGTQTFSGTPGAGDVGTVTITVRATDGGGLFVDDSFDITVNDVNSPPTDFDLDNLAVDENSAVGTLIGNLINIVDLDLPGDVHTFSIAPGGDPDGVFQITGTQLEVGGAMDFETATTHNVTIRVTDAGGLFYDELFTINVNDLNETPFNLIDNDAADNIANESASAGDTVGITGLASDLDAADAGGLNYTLDNDAGGRFAINAATGVVTVANPALLDFATNPNHTITVRATDAGGLFVTQNFTITVNRPPDDIQVTDGSVTGGFIFHFDGEDINGNGSTADNPADGTGINNWTDAAGIQGNGVEQGSGADPVLAADSVNNRDAVDFSATNSRYDFGDDATVNTSSYTQKTIHATFRTGTDVGGYQVIYEQGGSIRGYSISIDSGRIYGYVFNTAEWAPGFRHFPIDLGPVAANTTYSVTIVHDASPAGVVNDTFTGYVNGVQVGQFTNVDFQRPHSDNPGIGDVDGGILRPTTQTNTGSNNDFEGLIAELYSWNTALSAAQVRNLQDFQDAEWDFRLRVDENVAIGSVVGTLSANDPEPNNPVTFSVVGGSTNTFDIVGNNVVTIGNIDFETFTTHTLVVRATDSLGAFFDKTLTIDVVDIAADGGPAGPNPAFTTPDASFETTQESQQNRPELTQADLDELVNGGALTNYSAGISDGAVIHYTFDTESPFDETMQQVMRMAMAQYETAANIQFVEGIDEEQGGYDLSFAINQEGFGGVYENWVHSLSNGEQSRAQIEISDRYFDYEEMIALTGSAKGSFTYLTALHELGHALGLEDPHERSFEDSPFNVSSNTVMSYNLIQDYLAGSVYGRYTDALGAIDVATLQQLYGAPGGTPTGEAHGANSSHSHPFTLPTTPTASSGDFILINGIPFTFLVGADPANPYEIEFDTLDNMLQTLVSRLNSLDDPRLSQASYEKVNSNTIKITHLAGGDPAELFKVADQLDGLSAFVQVLDGIPVNQYLTSGNFIMENDNGTTGLIGSGSVSVRGTSLDGIILNPQNTLSNARLGFTTVPNDGDLIQIDDGDGGFLDFVYRAVANPLDPFEIQIGTRVGYELEDTLDNTVDKLNSWVEEFGSNENSYVMRQLNFTWEGQALNITSKEAGDVLSYNGNIAQVFSTVAGSGLSTNTLDSGNSVGVNTEGVANAEFYGSIQGFESDYLSDNRVSLKVTVGDSIYNATVSNTNMTSDTAVRLVSSSGGYFDIELGANNGFEVESQQDADLFAARINKAFEGMTFSQERRITNFNPSTELGITSIMDINLESYDDAVFFNSVEVTGMNESPDGEAQIAIYVNGERFRAKLGTDDNVSTDQLVRLVNDENQSEYIVWRHEGPSITVSTESEAQDLQELLESALPIGGFDDRKLISFQIGAEADQTLDIDIRAVTTQALFDDADSVMITTREEAMEATDEVREAIDRLVESRATIGSFASQADSIADSLDSEIRNQDEARGAIRDTNLATASTEYAKQLVKSQLTTAVLAQANSLHAQTVGGLLYDTEETVQ